MTEDFRAKNRAHVQRALDSFSATTEEVLQGHRDQFDSLRKPGEDDYEGAFGPNPIDWPREAAELAKRVGRDTKKYGGIWWQLIQALASQDEVLYRTPNARHQRTITLRNPPTKPVRLKPTRLRRLGSGAAPTEEPHRIVCEPEVLDVGSDGRFKVIIDVGGMDPGIYIGRVQTDADDEGEIEYSIYVSEVDAEAVPAA